MLLPPNPVTYSCRAKAIPQVLADLSKVTGVKMRAKEEARGEIVFLHVDGLPLDSLMRKIAFVTSCEWVKSGDSYTLEPSVSIRRREERVELSAKAVALKKGIEAEISEWEKEVKKGREPNINDFTDTSYLSLKLATLIDPESLAVLPPGKRMVWATDTPSEFEGGLPDESNQIVTDWVSRHNQVTQELSNVLANINVGGESSKAVADFQKLLTPLAPRSFKVLLEAEWVGEYLHLETRVFDRQGTALPFTSGTAIPTRGQTRDGLKKGFDVSLIRLVESPDTSVICRRYISTVHDGGHTVRLSAEQRAKFSDIENFDPLSYAASDVMESFRQNRHPQIVADLPDPMIDCSEEAVAGVEAQKAATNAYTLVEGGGLVQMSEEDAVCLLKPSRPAENRRIRVSRPDFAALLRDSLDHGCPNLAELSSFAADNPNFEHTPVGDVCEMLLGMSVRSSRGQASWEGLRFYASLSGEQVSLLESGRAIPISSLTQTQRELAADVALSNNSFLSNGKPLPPGEGDGYLEPGLSEERTELVAQGFRDGFLSCVIGSEPVMLVDGAETQFGGFLADADGLARLSPPMSGQKASTLEAEYPQRVQMGQSRRLELIFHLRKNASENVRLTDVQIASNSPSLSTAELPEEFLAKARAIAKEWVQVPLGSSKASP